jgi:hypothetical protein
MKRYEINEFHKVNDDIQIRVHSKKEDDGTLAPAKTFWLKFGRDNLFLTPERADVLVQSLDQIREFVEKHRDLVMGTAERKAAYAAKREEKKVMLKEEARIKQAVEAAAVENMRKLFAEGSPEKLALLADLFKKTG